MNFNGTEFEELSLCFWTQLGQVHDWKQHENFLKDWFPTERLINFFAKGIQYLLKFWVKQCHSFYIRVFESFFTYKTIFTCKTILIYYFESQQWKLSECVRTASWRELEASTWPFLHESGFPHAARQRNWRQCLRQKETKRESRAGMTDRAGADPATRQVVKGKTVAL